MLHFAAGVGTGAGAGEGVIATEGVVTGDGDCTGGTPVIPDGIGLWPVTPCTGGTPALPGGEASGNGCGAVLSQAIEIKRYTDKIAINIENAVFISTPSPVVLRSLTPHPALFEIRGENLPGNHHLFSLF